MQVVNSEAYMSSMVFQFVRGELLSRLRFLNEMKNRLYGPALWDLFSTVTNLGPKRGNFVCYLNTQISSSALIHYKLCIETCLIFLAWCIQNFQLILHICIGVGLDYTLVAFSNSKSWLSLCNCALFSERLVWVLGASAESYVKKWPHSLSYGISG